MSMRLEGARDDLVERAALHARARLPQPQAGLVEAFLRRYWARVAPEDVAGRDPADLYGAALAHLQLADKRLPGTARVRVYTPAFDDHGWASTHSVVQIVIDDMPFLVDSVGMELSRQGCGMHLVVHPVLTVTRDAAGRITGIDGEVRGEPDVSGEIPGPPGTETVDEAYIHVEIDRQPGPPQLDEIRAGLLRVLADVRAAVSDWPAMRERALALAAELEEQADGRQDFTEAAALLRFLSDDHFVFLGYRDYDLVVEDGGHALQPVAGSGLGILRDAAAAGRSQSFARVPAELRDQTARAGEPITVAKASARSTVHRPTALDYVGVKRYDAASMVTGERRFLGLYTSAFYRMPTSGIPVLRGKIRSVVERSGFGVSSHDGKALAEVIESYPRHELFEMPAEELFDVAMGILHLRERQRLRLFARRDRFGRFWSCFVYVPLDRYTQAVRRRITDILLEAFSGTGFEYSAQVGESVLARLHFLIHIEPAAGAGPPPDLEAVEARLAEATRAWVDDLYDALVDHYGEERGVALYRRWGDAFPAAYRDDYPVRTAVADIGRIEALDNGRLGLSLTHPLEAPEDLLRFKLFQSGAPLSLSDVLPLLENMGVRVDDQRPYEVRGRDREPVWIYDFGLHPEDGAFDTEAVKDVFAEAFAATWAGHAENDGFNRLVLAAGLTWREISALRAYCKYLHQIGSNFSQPYIEQTLVANRHVARLLVDLFHARFDPARHPDPDDEAALVVKQLEADIDAVASLDEDRILRSFLALVQATVRTNWFCGFGDTPGPGRFGDTAGPGGETKTHVAFKFDPSQVPDLPLPRPRFEIFVCSPRLEGVHLRGGRVSRGGIRWSDRREDFRTEVLGLMKAQMVKNAVIVPVGAKGGFVIKRPPGTPGGAGVSPGAPGGAGVSPGGTGVSPGMTDREALAKEVAACYATFVSGLLDLTDNIRLHGDTPGPGGEVVHPEGVVAYDGDDPYLVVAADKGTATFSDLANAIAADHGFWLGDAFASGGSSGYDHKKMGITARGAWESVKRHFRDLGVDVTTTPITVAGIGDMSGDVFGNGMLLSRRLRLVAAFDHRHIFLDPDPDPAESFAERERLFRLPRSSWADYDPERISAGGGVFPRTAKSIPISAEVRRALGFDAGDSPYPGDAEALRPNDLIRAILRAPVDLLWNGGIGTYVKASSETHGDVGDRANDGVRIDAPELRARVVGEGGNLGFTQRGRIEYALAGGRVNTDAIDNSAGVDCSDHEVNIKILLDTVVADGELTVKQRNRLLAEMAGDVAAMVLRDNYDQTAALGYARAQARALVDVHGRYLHRLEQEGKLDRALEFLPSDETLASRRAAGLGLTAPEFAVVLAYTKIDIGAQLLASDVPEDPWLSREMAAYFPEPLRSPRFAEAMERHPLRREIIATRLTNRLVDRAGTSFAHRLTEETGVSVPELVRAHVAAREIFGLDTVWAAVEALDNQVPAAVQVTMGLETRRLAERASRWLLRHRRPPIDIAGTVAGFAPGVAQLSARLPEVLSGAARAQMRTAGEAWAAEGVPADLAARVAALAWLLPTLAVVDVASSTERAVEDVAAVHFALGERLDLDWLRDRIEALPRDDRWQTLARDALRDDCDRQHAALTSEVIRRSAGGDRAGALDAWVDGNRPSIERFLLVLDDIRAGGAFDLATLSVAMREARALASAG